jgi:flagellar motor switch protein FliM
MSPATAEATDQIALRGAPVEEEIIQRAKRSYERLPILEVILERFVLAIGPALKTYVGALCEASIDATEYMPMSEALEGMPNPSLISITEASDWEGPFATVIDPSLLISTLEITFGGRTAERSSWKPRSFTAIERKIGREMMTLILAELSETFAKLMPVEFMISHVETNPQAMVLAPPNTGCLRLRVHLTMDDRDGYLYFLFPYNAFSTIRPILAQPFHGGALGGDKSWQKKMTDAIVDTEVSVAARLHETTVPMQEVLNWRKGQVLDLGIDADQLVTLCCGGHELYRAQSGKRRNGRLALKIQKQLKDEEEMSNVLPD